MSALEWLGAVLLGALFVAIIVTEIGLGREQRRLKQLQEELLRRWKSTDDDDAFLR